MKSPDEVREILINKFKNNHREWLKETGTIWPLEINLNIPTEQDALKQPEGVKAWISGWKTWKGNGTLVWSERRWRSLATQTVPERLILNNSNDAAVWAGESERWKLAVERYNSMVQSWPALKDTLPRFFGVLADYNDQDFQSLFEVLTWLCANPDSNLFIRQVPVAGIDSKWLESRTNLVRDLFKAIKDDTSGENDFYICCGLRPLPKLIRMRILDPEIKTQLNGLSDITALPDEIAALEITPAVVFFVENLQTGLAFNDLNNTVVIMGLGYYVDVLGNIPWIRQSRCVYWGDIDTHGLAILNRARSYIPNLESVFMDEITLMNYRELWVEEKKQSPSDDLPLLTGSEKNLFHALKNNVWGYHVRLEQERICWNEAWEKIKQFLPPR